MAGSPKTGGWIVEGGDPAAAAAGKPPEGCALNPKARAREEGLHGGVARKGSSSQIATAFLLMGVTAG